MKTPRFQYNPNTGIADFTWLEETPDLMPSYVIHLDAGLSNSAAAIRFWDFFGPLASREMDEWFTIYVDGMKHGA